MSRIYIRTGNREYEVRSQGRRVGKDIGGLGAVEPLTSGQQAVFLLDFGLGSKRGRCSGAPNVWDRKFVDSIVTEFRARQVGWDRTGGTAYPTVGWYGGVRNPGSAYQFLYIPSPAERFYRQFRGNMNDLGEMLAARLCQDEVFILHYDGISQKLFTATAKG